MEDFKPSYIGNGLIVVPVKEYERLRTRDAEYAALEAAGVDNWQGMEFVEWPEVEEG